MTGPIHLGDFKCILREQELDQSDLVYDPVPSSCENDKEALDSVKPQEFLLTSWQAFCLLRKLLHVVKWVPKLVNYLNFDQLWLLELFN